MCDTLIHEGYSTSGKVDFHRSVPYTDLSLSLVSVQLYFLLFTRNICTTRKDSTIRIFVGVVAYTHYNACDYVVLGVYPECCSKERYICVIVLKK